MSNTLDTHTPPPRCLRSHHTPKPEQDPPQHCPLPGGAGGFPAGLTSNLPMFCSSLTLLPDRYCQARPRSEGGIPFWQRSRICGRDTDTESGESTEHSKQRDSRGKGGARPAPRPQAGPLLLLKQGEVSLSPWDAGMPAGMAVKHQKHGGAARGPAEALWLANSSKQAWHCLKGRSCWELEKQTLESRWGVSGSVPHEKH